MKGHIAVATFAAVALTAAVAHAGQQPVTVYVGTESEQSGFIDPGQERTVSVAQDVRERIADKDEFSLVESPDDAVVQLIVVRTRSSFVKGDFAEAEIRVGDYSKLIKGEPSITRPRWGGIAKHLVQQLEKWVKSNASALAKKQHDQGALASTPIPSQTSAAVLR